MALSPAALLAKQQAEDVRDMADRIARIIIFSDRASVQFDEKPDLELILTAEVKQQLQAKVQTLRADIKAIVAGW